MRTRLRAFAGTSLALALLVAVTAALAAAYPRAVDRYGDAGLRRAVEEALPDLTTVRVTAPPARWSGYEEAEAALRPDALATAQAEVLGAARTPLAPDREQSSYGVRSTVVPLDDWLPRPSDVPAEMVVAVQQDLDSHARVTEGRMPRTDGPVTAATEQVEAVVTEDTARALRIEVGSVIHLPDVEGTPLAVRISGIVVPRAPQGAYWATLPVLRAPALSQVPGSIPADYYWLGGLLLAPDAGPALLGVRSEDELTRYWHLAPDLDALRAHDLDRLSSAVAALETGPGAQHLRSAVDQDMETQTGLDEVLASHARLRAGISPLLLLAAVGAGTLAVIVLAMAGAVTAERRRAELALLRARGASLPRLALRLLAETAVVAVPAGALGLAAALFLLPGARTGAAVAAAVAVTLFACLVLPLRAAAAHRTVRLHEVREDLATARPSRRRTVAELTVLVVAVAAVLALRRQGSGSTGPVAGAPVLTGVVTALLLVRLHPLPLRALSRATARARGPVVPLSLAHAARASGLAVLPLLALIVALTTAAFGGSVLAGVTAARDQAALLAVGADARVESASGVLPRGLADRVRRLPGVRDAVEAGVAYEARPLQDTEPVPLAGVDPGPYADLSRRTGLGAFDAADLRAAAPGTAGDADSGDDQPLPALASPGLAERYGTAPAPVRLPDGSTVTLRIVTVRDRTPAVVGDEFLVVDRAGLPGDAARATTLLLTGDALDGKALRAAARDAAGATGAAGTSDAEGTADAADAAGAEDLETTVRLRAEEHARNVGSPLQSGAERLYAAAVLAGAGYAVLALLLTVLRTAPEHRALLARLRTMGMTRAQGRRLLVLTALPQALPAAVGGVLAGWAGIRLTAPGVDLTAVALTSPSAVDTVALRADPLSLTVPALVVLLLAVGVPAGQAWWTSRRGSAPELRLGDR
ncbi:FtsX-like permease family protein [Streptomyces sp. NPDC056600]|uniref:FtsX-like permease family protein n=1 Tax=Streptomyces sp. NPDC056600 TaxID=3345874 RepID=UPI0036BEE887